MIEFKPAPHTPKELDVVEVWLDGQMVATIYPHGDNGILIRTRNTYKHCAVGNGPDNLLEYLFQFHV